MVHVLTVGFWNGRLCVETPGHSVNICGSVGLFASFLSLTFVLIFCFRLIHKRSVYRTAGRVDLGTSVELMLALSTRFEWCMRTVLNT